MPVSYTHLDVYKRQMVNTLLLSSDVVMDHKEKKELVKKFISPDLCDITEKLVLMEPYMDLYDRNNCLLYTSWRH